MNNDELKVVLEKHLKWLRSEEDGERADLAYANLTYANLAGTNLTYADLAGADLAYANLTYANLAGADLAYANLAGADLVGANLTYANLAGADFKNVKNLFYPLACPEEGSFIAFKKVAGYIVKLCIPEDAKRSSATTRKCRCDKARVVEIQNTDGTTAYGVTEIDSDYDGKFTYRIGEEVTSAFDPNRWNECAPGIHFFVTREEAVGYNN